MPKKKKWKKRLKKLAKAALIGGALYAGSKLLKGRKTAAADVDSGRGSGLRDTVGSTKWITKKSKDILPKTKVDTGSNTGSNGQTRFTAQGADGKWRGPMEHKRYMDSTAGNRLPPSMRGGAETAQGFVRKVPISRTGRGKGAINYGWTTDPYKKGGRVAAKTGGRIRKQFGGALPVGSTARRDMRSGYYPSDMGMRGGPMYKKGGRVTGIAKRGFGRALMKGKK